MASITRFEDLQSWQKARQLYLALDRKYISADELKTAYDLATESKRLINGMIAYLRKKSGSQVVFVESCNLVPPHFNKVS